MDALRQMLSRIASQLKGLTATQKLLIASMCVIALMTLFLVSQYAGTRDMVPLMDADPNRDMVRVLSSRHIPAEVRGGQVYVPASSQRLALAALAESDALPGDTQLLFNNLIEHQKWTNSREQNQQQFDIALQNELGRVISMIKGVRRATVIIDAPDATGIGLVAREPTASATIVTTGGPLTRKTADTIAHLIAGAKAGLRVEQVQVIDAASGRSFRASDEGDLAAGAYIEHVAAIEKRMRAKLMDLYQYIPGVIVAVTAHVDIAREDIRSEVFLSPEEGGTVSLLGSETSSTSTQSTVTAGGEPGLRSNVTASINRGSGSPVTSSEQSESETKMENHVGSKVTHRIDPKGHPTRLVASIQIPRDYVVRVLEQELGEDGEAPTEEQIRQRFDAIRSEIEQNAKPHLDTEETAGEVRVSMIPVALPGGEAMQPAGMFGQVAGGGGVLGLDGGLIETAVLGLLGLVSVGLMLMMVRRASRPVKMPTAEELVGLPPELETESDLVGDVGESEEAIAGMELDEDDVEAQRMLQSVMEQAKAEPEALAQLLKQWVSPED